MGITENHNLSFVTFWHGNVLTTMEWMCMRSFVERGLDYGFYSYQDIKVPEGVHLRSADEIIPRQNLFYFDGSPSAFSNLFRYKLLAATNSWWVDTDVYYCGKQIPDVDYCWAEEEAGKINGAVLKLGPDASLPNMLYEVALEGSRTLDRWGQLGPDLLTEHLGSMHPASYYGGQYNIYPVHWLEAYYYWLPEFYDEIASRSADSTFHHLWNSILTRALDIDPNLHPPKGSFLDTLYKTCFLTEAQISRISLNDIRQKVLKYLSQDWVRRACSVRGINLKSPLG